MKMLHLKKKKFFPISSFMFLWNYASTPKFFTISRQHRKSKLYELRSHSEWGMAQSLSKHWRTEFTESTAHFQREEVKQKHTDMEITLLIHFQLPLHRSILCRQRTNKPLKESNHSKWIKHFFYIYCAQYNGLKSNLCYAHI